MTKRKRDNSTVGPVKRDPQKEAVFSSLSTILGGHGVKVRREELKSGHGWKVVSGACRLKVENMVFVDRRLPQDDQITFLAERINQLGISVGDDQLSQLPANVVGLITRSALAA